MVHPHMRQKIWAVKWRCPTVKDSSLVATPQGASTALCQNEYANVNLTTHSALVRIYSSRVWHWFAEKYHGRVSFPDTQPVLVHVDRWMAYDDHYLKWSRVEQWKTIGMEGGMSVPGDDELHWVPPVYFQARNLKTQSPNLNRGRERLQVMGSVDTGTGFNNLY